MYQIVKQRPRLEWLDVISVGGSLSGSRSYLTTCFLEEVFKAAQEICGIHLEVVLIKGTKKLTVGGQGVFLGHNGKDSWIVFESPLDTFHSR